MCVRIVTRRVVTHSTYMLPPTEPNTVRIPRRGGVCRSCAKCFRCICFSGCLSYIPTITAANMTWRYTPRRSPSMFTCRFIDKRSFITRFDSICLRSMSVELCCLWAAAAAGAIEICIATRCEQIRFAHDIPDIAYIYERLYLDSNYRFNIFMSVVELVFVSRYVFIWFGLCFAQYLTQEQNARLFCA